MCCIMFVRCMWLLIWIMKCSIVDLCVRFLFIVIWMMFVLVDVMFVVMCVKMFFVFFMSVFIVILNRWFGCGVYLMLI